jgi:hypothetical protein
MKDLIRALLREQHPDLADLENVTISHRLVRRA